MFNYIFSDIDTLLEIEQSIRDVLNEPYYDRNQIEKEGKLPIHVSYEAQIMQVLQGFAGRYEIKRAVFGEPDENGNVEITWEKVK